MKYAKCSRETCPSYVTAGRLASNGMTERQRTFCSDLCHDWQKRWERIDIRRKRSKSRRVVEGYREEMLELAMLAESLNAWRTAVDARRAA